MILAHQSVVDHCKRIMAPNTEWKIPSISRKFPSYRNEKVITVHSWLDGRRREDDAEGLWRIHDNLYDLTEFIDNHPGGQFWIQETKGTDITEAFETHHLKGKAEKMLPKYFIREAKEPRNILLTLKEDGFYKTLKKRVAKKLEEDIDFKPAKMSNMIHDLILFTIITSAILYSRYNHWIFLLISGVTICWSSGIAHNYFHRKDNWRMYTFNLSLMNFRDWRILHVLSHHFYANTFHDLELSLYEPVLCWVPNPHIKSKLLRFLSVLYGPILYFFGFKIQFLLRVFDSILNRNVLYWHDWIGLSIPTIMVLATNDPVSITLLKWLLIISVASFMFHVIGLNAAHHDPKILHEGDALRADRDWGLFTLDTIIDRRDLKGSQFLVLTHFGEHILHHLFPTIDHGVLPQLYPALFETIKEFGGQVREQSYLSHVIGQNLQLNRTVPNAMPPGGEKTD